MWREGGPECPIRPGDRTSQAFLRTRSSIKRTSARSMISAASPVGMAWRKRSWRQPQPLARFGARREADLEPLRRQRCDDGWSGGRSRRNRQRRTGRCAYGSRGDAGDDRDAGGWPLRNPPDRSLDVRSRKTLRDQQLHLALVEVGGRVEKVAVVLRGQVRRQQPHGGQVHGTFREGVEHGWKPPSRTSRLEAVVGLVLRKVERLAAVGEQRREACGEMEPAERRTRPDVRRAASWPRVRTGRGGRPRQRAPRRSGVRGWWSPWQGDARRSDCQVGSGPMDELH